MVGESPSSPGEFVVHLLAKDRGWLGAYFDAVSRLSRTQQAHFVQDGRLQRLYAAYRSGAPRTDAMTGVFPRDADLLVFLTSVKWKENGDADIPGDLTVWQDIFSKKRKDERDSVRRRDCCDTSERLLETLAAESHIESDSGPVEIFLTLSALNAGRLEGRRLSNQTEELIASKQGEFNRWFPIFAEFPSLDNAAVAQFISAADRIGSISNPTLRANALGAFQAEVGLWQIFARQGEIPADKLNAAWLSTVQPYTGVSNSLQLFDAARSSLQGLLTTTAGKANLSQDEIIDLLAGPPQQSEDGRRVHLELAERIRAVMDDQRLASLDTLFGLCDGLTAMVHGADIGKSLLPLAGNLHEFEMPRPIFTGTERASWSPLVYTSRHAELQIRTDLTKIIQAPGSPSQLEAARGELTPFLRDTLVGLNYAYYEPPGAEVLHNNPLFVRSHDFSSISVLGYAENVGRSESDRSGRHSGRGRLFDGLARRLALRVGSHRRRIDCSQACPGIDLAGGCSGPHRGRGFATMVELSRDELHAAALYQRAGRGTIRRVGRGCAVARKGVEHIGGSHEPATARTSRRHIAERQSSSALSHDPAAARRSLLPFRPVQEEISRGRFGLG